MARPLRIQYPGAVYHITCRGNERRDIFRDDKDRYTFLELLKDSLETYSPILYTYVLMDNHFHLLLETPLGNLSEFMRHLNISYTSFFNRRYDRCGHLYQGRYKSILVDKEGYLIVLSRYIHLNPVRVKYLEKRDLKEKLAYLKRYPWSSLPGYIYIKNKVPWIDYSSVLEGYGGDNNKRRRSYLKVIGSDLSNGLEIKKEAQSLIGRDEFIDWVRNTFIKEKNREIPATTQLNRRPKQEVLEVIEEETGQGRKAILYKRGILRQIAMEFLYRASGLTGPEIGSMMKVDYSTVSQNRKRLREKLKRDNRLEGLFRRIEYRLSI